MKLLILPLLAVYFTISIYSQSVIHDVKTVTQDSDKSYFLEPVIITGTRTEILSKYMPLSITSINELEIKQNGDPSVLSLLSSRVPGLFVSKRSQLGFGLAQGSAGQIYIRGTGGNPNSQVLILLDGRPQFMGLMGHPLPDNYISANVEKIEVIRGPCSFLYGSNAMGGVINIISKQQKKEGLSVNINQSYGTYSTLVGDAGIGFNTGKFNMYISVSDQQSNGGRNYSEFRLNNGYSKIGYDINKNFKMTADANLTKFKTYDPGTVYKPLIDNWVDIFRGNAGFTVDNKFNKTDGSVKFLYNYGKHNIYDGFISEDKNISLTAYQSYKFFKGNIISTGIDYKYYGGKASNTITGKDWGEFFVNEYAAYFQIQQRFFKKISLNGGLRIEHNSVYGSELIPQAGITFSLHKTTTARVSVSKGFRSPTIRELYLFPAPNPLLLPEEMWNYEAGIISSPLSNLLIDIAAFYDKGSNIILTEGVYPNLKLSNSGAFQKKGFEISVKYNPASFLGLNSNYSFVDPDQQTLSVPWHKFYAEAQYRHRYFGINLSAEHISKIYGDNFSRKRLEDYTLLNAKVFIFPVKGLNFFVEAENLLNKEYQVIYGYPMPKTTFTLGINYNY